jgi:GTP pyrophosphokinase
LINDVSRVISEELKVNMSSLSFKSDQGIFNGEIMLYVNDTRHLEMLIKKLEKVEGVVEVARFDSRNTGPVYSTE